jgi:hypothetical protein
MRPAHIGRLLLTLGLLVGVAASIGLSSASSPPGCPRTLINLAAYKLTYIAALGLLAGGAMLLRLARRPEPGAAAIDDARLRGREYDPQLVDARRPGRPQSAGEIGALTSPTRAAPSSGNEARRSP